MTQGQSLASEVAHPMPATAQITFAPYARNSRGSCLALFDANCPDFFAPNERDEYSRFLDSNPPGYELCLIDANIVGAFGLAGDGDGKRRLNWILLNPMYQGVGAGRAMMERVSARAASEGVAVVEIAASHKSAAFFARFGAVSMKVTHDGWGPDMHRVDMEWRLP